MELSYVFHAAKRYWWTVVVCVLFTMSVAFVRAKPAEYVSRATINATTTSANGESPDRLVATAVSQLSSQPFAARVGRRLHLRPGLSALEVQGLVTVANRSGTDLVDIVAKNRSPRLAKAVVHAYTAEYVEELKQRAGTNLRQVVKQQADLTKAMEGYANGALVPQPLLAQQQLLNNQYTQWYTVKAQADAAAAPGSTLITEPGTDPIWSGKSRVKTYLPFLLLGLLGGIFLAVALARLSKRVLDAEEVAEIIGRPVVARLPKGLASPDNKGPWRSASPEAASVLDELCTRVESCGRAAKGLTILVAGTESDTNAAPLGAAMAARFGEWGLDVAFGDADAAVSGLFPRTVSTQRISEVLADAEAPGANRLPRPARRRMTFVDMADEADAAALHRNGPEHVLSILSAGHDVVLVVSGPLLEARAAAQLAPLVDVVVLVVPVHRQTRRRLHAVAEQLTSRRGSLLVVDDGGTRKGIDDEQTHGRDGQVGGAVRPQRPTWPPPPTLPARMGEGG